MEILGLNSTIFWSLLGLAIVGLILGLKFIIGNVKKYQFSFARTWYFIYFFSLLPVFFYFIYFGQNVLNYYWIIASFFEGLLLVIPFFIIKKVKFNEKFESNLFSRNNGFIFEDLQNKIKKTRLLLVGCGLGSQIGILATRSGFEKFILCDGDRVELNNLNRQGFNISDIGRNKAKVLKKKILAINPKCRVDVYPKFVKNKEEAKRIIEKADIIVNMADPEEIMYEINNESQKQGKFVLSPLNFGFEGYIIIFGPETITMEKLIGGRFLTNEFYMHLINNTIGRIPEPLLIMLQKYGEKIMKGEMPAAQLATASYQTSAGIVNSIIKILDNKPIKMAPQAIVIGEKEEK